MSFDAKALQRLCRSQPVARVLIAAVRGSAPREAGAALLVTANGFEGTIGGGTLEHQALQRARSLLAQDSPAALLEQIPLGAKLGQCCGGRVTLVIEVFAKGWQAGNASYALRNLSGAPKPLAIARAERAWRSGQHTAQLMLHDGWIMEPPTQPGPPLWLYGAGHVGRAIANCLQGLNLDLTWVDTAPERFPQPLPDGALVAQDPADCVRFAPPDAHHLVLTYSHALDLELCHRILSQPHASVGLIGSATKRARFERALRDLGHADAALGRLTCPIGDPGLGKAPKAIAIGVVAQLITRLHSAQQAEGLPQEHAQSS